MVQPSAVIEPQPNKMPPTKAVDVFLTVNFENSNLPPAIAAAKDPPTKPKTNQPHAYFVLACGCSSMDRAPC